MVSRRRREQGHPAKIAARRERERGKRWPKSPAESFCSLAGELESAMDAELFASQILGTAWREGGLDPPEERELELAGPLIEEIAAHGGPGAAVILAAIRELASADLAARAAELGDGIAAAGAAVPEWAQAIGQVGPARTAVMSESIFDDGRTYFIESTHADGTSDAVGIYVDNNLGRTVKDILLAGSIDEVEATIAAHPDEVAEVTIEDIDPALLASRVRAAFELTDSTIAPIVEEEFAGLRALALHRLRSLPEVDPDGGIEEFTADRRAALLADFLAAPEGEAIEPDSDAAGVVESAIDFCADYVDGRPTRWSPVVVELFMADWLPRKVVADDAFFAAVPEALAAWVRFAGPSFGAPDRAVATTLAAIPVYEREMRDALADPDRTSPGTELAMALRDAEIDPTDEVALATFIAGWNARSLLDER